VGISSNYLTLQQQIADELGDRQDLLTPLADSPLTLGPIQNAIQSAIARWERESFYFNQFLLQVNPNGSNPLVTSVGQEYYGKTTTPNAYDFTSIASIKKAWIYISSNRYPLNPRTTEYLDDVSVNPANTGEPTDWAFSAMMLRLYPISNSIYPVGFEGVQKLAALVNPGDSNCWTQDAFDLIRSEAKLILAQEVLSDADLEASMTKAIYGTPGTSRKGYLADLKGETVRRSARGKIRPTIF
jgi:hypothetical protein